MQMMHELKSPYAWPGEIILKTRKELEQQSISRTSDTMPFLFFSQFAPRKTFLWKTGKKNTAFFFFLISVAVSLLLFGVSIAVNAKSTEQIHKP